MCRGMIITNNQIGPAGHAPNTGFQFKKRDSTGNYGPGQWADGISMACFQSTISNNVRPLPRAPFRPRRRTRFPHHERRTDERDRRLSSMRPMELSSASRAPRPSPTTRSSPATDSSLVESIWSIGDQTSEITRESSFPETRLSPRATLSRSVSPLVECLGGASALSLAWKLSDDLSQIRQSNGRSNFRWIGPEQRPLLW